MTCNSAGQFTIPIPIDLNSNIGYGIDVLSTEANNPTAIIKKQTGDNFDTAPKGTLNPVCPETYSNSDYFVCKTHFPTVTGTCDVGSTVNFVISYLPNFAKYYDSKVTAFTSPEVACSSTGTYSIPVTTRLDNATTYININNNQDTQLSARRHFINVKVFNATKPNDARVLNGQVYKEFSVFTLPEVAYDNFCSLTGYNAGTYYNYIPGYQYNCTTSTPTITGTCSANTYFKLLITSGQTEKFNYANICPTSGLYSVPVTSYLPNGIYGLSIKGIDPFDANVFTTKLTQLAISFVPSATLSDFCIVNQSSAMECQNHFPVVTGVCNYGTPFRVVVGNNNTTNQNYLDISSVCGTSGTFSFPISTFVPTAFGNAYKAETFVNNIVSSTKLFGINPSSFVTLSDFCPTFGNGLRCTTKFPTFTGTCRRDDNLKIEVKGENANGYTNQNSIYSNNSICPTNGIFNIIPDVAIYAGLSNGDYYKIIASVQDPLIPLSNDSTSKLFDSSSSVSIGLISPILTSDQTPSFSGTCAPVGASVKLIITPGNEELNTVCSATGTYSATPTNNIPFGIYLVKAQAFVAGILGDQVINNGTISNIFANIKVPALSRINKPVITGDCEPNSTLVFSFAPVSQVVNTSCPVAGQYSISPSNAIAEGGYSVNLLATSPANAQINLSGTGEINTLTFVSLVIPNPSTNKLPTITGTCVSGTTINFTIVPTNEQVTLTCPANETFSFVATQSIPDGNYGVNAVVNSSPPVSVFGIMDASTYISISTPPLTDNHYPTISGLCEGGSALTFNIIPTGESKRMNCSSIGTFSFVVTNYISDGTYTINGGAIDNKGNTATATANGEITSKTFITITKPLIVNTNNPAYSGTCEAGSTITLTITSLITPSNEIGNTTCLANGTFVFDTITPMLNGSYRVKVNAKDIYNNTIEINKNGTINSSVVTTVVIPPTGNNHFPIISGNCEPASIVKVTIIETNEIFDFICPTVTALGIQPQDPITNLPIRTLGTVRGQYNILPTISIPDGFYSVRTFAKGLLNHTGLALGTGIVDASTVVSINVPITSNNTRPQFTGSCEIGATLSITVKLQPSNTLNQIIPNFICNNTGTYIVTPPISIPTGDYRADVTAVDIYSNVGTSFDTGNILPGASFVTISVPALTNDNTPTITGTCESGSNLVVKVYKVVNTGNIPTNVLSETLPFFVCNNTGIYSNSPTIPLPDGGYVATIDSSNTFGVPANAISNGIIDTTTFVTISVPPLTNNPKPLITGTCEKGANVNVSISIGITNTTTNETFSPFVCNNTGTYSLTPTINIPDGSYCGNATTVDLAINSATAIPSCGVIDTSTFVTIDVPALTNNPKPTIVGTCEKGATITITTYLGSANILSQILPAFVCNNTGTYSIAPTTTLPDGVFKATANATDLAGNIATANDNGVIDTITLVTVLVPSITNNPKPSITGTCEAGATVIVTLTTGNINPILQTLNQTLPSFVCQLSGAFTVTPTSNLPDGNYCGRASSTDLANNSSTAAPSCGVVDTSTFVTISVPALTNSHYPKITGTCEAGASLEIKVGSSLNTTTFSGIPEVINQVCPGNGNYLATPTVNIPNGDYIAKVVALDAAGNTATATDNGVIDDTINITITVPQLTNDPTPSLTGICKLGATVTINITTGANNTFDQSLPAFTCDSTKTYTISPTANIPNGPFCANASSVDSLGNSAGPVSDCGIIDTSTFITISVPALINNPKPPITGTCEAGANVNVAITAGVTNIINQTFAPFVCNNTGTYSLIPNNNIPDGSYCGNATTVDLAGNNASAIPSCGVVDTSTFVTIITPTITNNPRPAITGTCEAGASVILNITIGANNTSLQTLPVFVCTNLGTYSQTPTIDIPQGAYCIGAGATDLAGNTASASGCGNIFVTIIVPITTTDSTPVISGSCPPSTASGFQVPVEVTIRTGFSQNGQTGNLVEIVNTICSTNGIYTITPTLPIPTGLFTAIAKATDAIGNIATAVGTGEVITPIVSSSSLVVSSSLMSSSAIASSSLSGGVIIITQSSITPEVFDNLSDPYVCGGAITGQVISNYGIKNVVVKLFTRRGDGSYETQPKYIFRPSLDNQGKYSIQLDYANEANFVKANYRIEYTAISKTATTKIDSYLASTTNQCEQPKPTIVQESIEIKPDGTTIRTGGASEVYYIFLSFALILISYSWYRLRRIKTNTQEVFGK